MQCYPDHSSHVREIMERCLLKLNSLVIVSVSTAGQDSYDMPTYQQGRSWQDHSPPSDALPPCDSLQSCQV